MDKTKKRKLRPGFAARLRALINGEIPEAPLQDHGEVSDEILMPKPDTPLQTSIPIKAHEHSEQTTKQDVPANDP